MVKTQMEIANVMSLLSVCRQPDFLNMIVKHHVFSSPLMAVS